jgi:aryl-alcohol dehydrogenase-like predicted oxidoreductase
MIVGSAEQSPIQAYALLERGLINLIYREEEREMLPLCRDQNIALTPYSPLAAGRLTRNREETTKRFQTDKMARSKYDSTVEADSLVVERLVAVAEKRGIPRVEVALAWVMQKAPVSIPIVGVTKLSQLESTLPALSVKLSVEEMAFLEEPYVPHRVIGAL